MEACHLDLNKLLASSGRQKLLKELAKCKELNVMALVRRLNSPYNEVNRNLGILEKEGIIINDYRKRVRRGKVRMIILNRENPKTKILLQVLKTLDTAEVNNNSRISC
jgi:predicted transcriptional regulator